MNDYCRDSTPVGARTDVHNINILKQSAGSQGWLQMLVEIVDVRIASSQ